MRQTLARCSDSEAVEIAAAPDDAGVDVSHGGRLAGEGDVGDFFVAVAGADGGTGTGADFAAVGATVGDGFACHRIRFCVLERLDDDVEVGDCERRAGDLEDVGSRFAIFCST